MSVRVGINGFGRIGRNVCRALWSREGGGGADPDVEIVAVNDLAPPATNAHLLAHDSTYGSLPDPVSLEDGAIRAGKHLVRVLAEPDPKALAWGDLGVDIVIESTGRFTSREKAAAHLEAGAGRVVISAPSSDADAMFVVGVNDDAYDPERHHIVSNASCTTNCFVPMVKVIDDAFGIIGGLMTTVHAYTNDQNLLDLVHKDLRRARAAAVNIIPTTTGAARSTGIVLTHLRGHLDGLSLRVPVVDGSITDLTAVVSGTPSREEVNAAFAAAAGSGSLARVLQYEEAPLVSTDIVGRPASCVFDALLTMTMPLPDAAGPLPEAAGPLPDAAGPLPDAAGPLPESAPGGQTLVKVFGWYDNEWGYANRLVDLVRVMGAAEGKA